MLILYNFKHKINIINCMKLFIYCNLIKLRISAENFLFQIQNTLMMIIRYYTYNIIYFRKIF